MPPRLGSEQARVLRLLHVDSDGLFLAGLRVALPPEWHVISARLGEEEPPAFLKQPWDVCVLGMSEKTVRGAFACLLQIGRMGHPVVAWMSRDIACWIPTLDCCGTAGYLSRSASAEELRVAVRAVMTGTVFVDRRLLGGSRAPLRRLADLGMTRQQERVATLYAVHKNRRRVATALGLSENTVKYHLRSIYEKTGASSLHGLQQVLRSRGWAAPRAEQHLGVCGPPADYPLG